MVRHTLAAMADQPALGLIVDGEEGEGGEAVMAHLRELRNQVRHLLRSNAELEEALLLHPLDPDFTQAIAGTPLPPFSASTTCMPI